MTRAKSLRNAAASAYPTTPATEDTSSPVSRARFAAHVAFFETYLAGHPREAAMSASMSSPRLMMIAMGPVVGLVSGLVLGLFAWGASRFVKPASA